MAVMRQPEEQPEEQEEQYVEPLFLTPVLARLLFGSKETPIGLYHLYKGSVAQLTRLHHKGKSDKLTQKRLRKLADDKYVLFDERPTQERRSPYYYVLSNKAIEEARSLGLTVSDSYRPSKEIGKSYYHLLHHLGVNDVVISAAILKRYAPSYSLADFKLERELASTPYPTTWRDKPYNLKPDAFLNLRKALPEGRQRIWSILIEHDRDTEQEEVIRRKVRAYASMIADGWHKTQFGINTIRVAFTTFEGEKRRDKLRAWTKQELQGENKSLISSFVFTTQEQPPDPTSMWLGRCWYTPTSDQPISLLANEEAPNAHA